MHKKHSLPNGEKTTFQLSESDTPWDIRYDDIFKAVFTRETPESNKALSCLISALIGKKIIVQTLKPNEPAIENKNERKIRFDINCISKEGELINIEMFYFPLAEEKLRLEYYASRLFGRQEIQGQDNDYTDLYETYQISILNHDRFFNDRYLIHKFQYYDIDHKMTLEGKSKIITLELCKAKYVIDKPVEKMADYEVWALYFEYLTKKEKRATINELIKREEGLAMASSILFNISQNEYEQAMQESRLKYILDERTRRNSALREGEAKGFKKGEAKGRIEIARNMINLGLSVDIIAKSTNLSVEEVNKLITNN